MNTNAVDDRKLPDDITRKLLDAVAKEPTISQRALSDRFGIALGLVNAYVKRLCKKGHLKITTLPRNRISYLITPKGFAEKARLTCSYVDISINYFKSARAMIEHLYASLLADNCRRIVLWGDGEMAELCYISTRGLALEIVCVVSHAANGHDFFGKPVISPDMLNGIQFDVVLIASNDDIFNQLAYEFVSERDKIHSLASDRMELL
ncbi:MAG TPA: winged helix-turn-helix transcriptional regulator [Dissulfurispiraceae bacterium]|nr:winged helix-turn-helix transcriptional regulator [Dissulfurispiraceae bacterium]